MKITKFFALLCAATVGFVGCEPIDNGEKPNPEPKPEPQGSITLSVDQTAIELGDSVTFTVTDSEGNDVTSAASIYNQDLDKVSNPYTPTASGSYTFNATIGAENSNNVTVTVMAEMPEVPTDPDKDNLAFNHRVVLIDHTGVNCGYCPEATDNLIALSKTEWHQYYNEVTCHAGSFSTGDPANSAAANALMQFQNSLISGYPTICLNFYSKAASRAVAAMKSALEANVKKDGADAGISLAVAGDNTTIYCAAQVKAKESKEYKVVAWLLESGIYSPNQAGASKDYHKIYNYALRNISGDYSKANVSGTSIGVLEAGKTYDCAFQLPIISTKWKYENMGVLVIVSAKDAQGRWEVANSAYCKVGEEKTYEYVE